MSIEEKKLGMYFVLLTERCVRRIPKIEGRGIKVMVTDKLIIIEIDC